MHMDAATILELGAAILALGSAGLFIVRGTNHRLRGLGWLGAAFAAGFLGAIFLTLPDAGVLLGTLGSDLCVLLGFALLHVAVMELMQQRRLFCCTSLLLLLGLTAADALVLLGILPHRTRMAAVSLAVALQCAQSAHLLWKTARPAERIPALFCSLILSFFAAYNLVRAGICEAGLIYHWIWYPLLVTGGYALYIAIALGLAFGFFWMSTSQLSHQLEHIAGTDPLTRVQNRRSFLAACERELELSQRRQRPFSILLIDLDHFKSINDRFGHDVGDAALVAAVHAMQDSIRGSDVLARWGGEEFAALLPNASLDAAHIVAERIRANVERIELPISTEGPDGPTIVTMTVSIGLATCDIADNVQTIMSRADRNLYLAKDSGRNRVLSAEPLDQVLATGR